MNVAAQILSIHLISVVLVVEWVNDQVDKDFC